MYEQLVTPNLAQKALGGLCLFFTRSSFGAPAVSPTAWKAWLATKYKHTDALPNVSVPVWFYHEGAYGTPAKWDNWGHVAINVPGRGVLSSPITFKGPGQEWFSSIEDLVNTINRIAPKSKTRYVGWSEDISNVTVVKENSMDGNKVADAVAFILLATGMGNKPDGYGDEGQIKYFSDQIKKSPADGINELAHAVYNSKPNNEMRYKAFNKEGGYPALVAQISELKKQLASTSGTIPTGTYLKIDKSNVIEVE